MSARSRAYPWWGPRYGSPDIPEPKKGDPGTTHFDFTANRSERVLEWVWYSDEYGTYAYDRLAAQRLLEL